MDLLAWSGLEPHLAAGHACLLNVGGTQDVQIGFAPERSRIFARAIVRDRNDVPTGSFAEIDVNYVDIEDKSFLEISTASREMFRAFHSFVLLFAEQLEENHGAVSRSFWEAMQQWRQLGARKTILTPEQQLGLIAELMLLNALIREYGAGGLDAWIASDHSTPQRHDFRIRGIDIEVKATRSTIRRHYIHGLQQLVPAEGRKLYILSIRLEPGGSQSGNSLADYVAITRAMLASNANAGKRFEDRLRGARYEDVDADQYNEKLILADSPLLIPVDDSCPRVVPAMIRTALPPSLAERIEQVTYMVNVEGLGYPLGSPQFANVLGHLSLEESI